MHEPSMAWRPSRTVSRRGSIADVVPLRFEYKIGVIRTPSGRKTISAGRSDQLFHARVRGMVACFSMTSLRPRRRLQWRQTQRSREPTFVRYPLRLEVGELPPAGAVVRN